MKIYGWRKGYLIAMPFLLAVIIGAMAAAVIATRDATCAIPFVIAFLAVARMVRTCQFWLSTGPERALLNPERESLIGPLSAWFRGKLGNSAAKETPTNAENSE